jgi:hypothetical protein
VPARHAIAPTKLFDGKQKLTETPLNPAEVLAFVIVPLTATAFATGTSALNVVPDDAFTVTMLVEATVLPGGLLG